MNQLVVGTFPQSRSSGRRGSGGVLSDATRPRPAQAAVVFVLHPLTIGSGRTLRSQSALSIPTWAVLRQAYRTMRERHFEHWELPRPAWLRQRLTTIRLRCRRVESDVVGRGSTTGG